MTKPFVIKVPLHVDDRGSVYCVVDGMNTQHTDCNPIKRTYVVHNWEKGRIRAWHGHRNGWTGMHVIHGAAKLVGVPIDDDGGLGLESDAVIATLSDKSPGIFWVPPGHFNGSISLVDDTKILVYSTLSFEEVKQDDVRATITQNDIMNFFKVVNR